MNLLIDCFKLSGSFHMGLLEFEPLMRTFNFLNVWHMTWATGVTQWWITIISDDMPWIIEFHSCLQGQQDSPAAQMVKNLPAMQETQVWYLGQVDPLETGMATHCSILAWGIPSSEGSDGLQSIGSHKSLTQLSD